MMMSVDQTVLQRRVNADGAIVVKDDVVAEKVKTTNAAAATTTSRKQTKDGRTLPILAVSELQTDEGIDRSKIGRGVSAVKTPSRYLSNAERAHIECDINVDSLAYWNIGETQPETNPFQSEGYITFAPDRGGWNNVSRLFFQNKNSHTSECFLGTHEYGDYLCDCSRHGSNIGFTTKRTHVLAASR